MPGVPTAPTLPKLTGPEAKAWRLRMGLTVAKLAPQLGVTERAINMWEHGKRCPWYLYALYYWLEGTRRTLDAVATIEAARVATVLDREVGDANTG